MATDVADRRTEGTARGRLPPFLWALAAGSFVVGTGAFVIGGIVEPLAQSLGVSVSAAGQLMTVYALANAVLAPLLLAWAGRYDARTVLLGAIAVLAASAAASALTASWSQLAVARVLMATGAGLYTPTAAALAVALVPAAARGRARAVPLSGSGLSYHVGGPVGAWAGYSTHGWPLAFWGLAAAALGVLALLVHAPRGVATAPASLTSYASVLRGRQALLALAATGAFFATIFCIFTFVGAFLREYAAVPEGSVATVLAGFGVAALAGTFGGGWLADRVGPTRMLYAICAGFVVVFAVLWAIPGRPVPVVAAFLAWGAIGFAFYAAQQARLVAMAPQAATAMLALNATMLYLGQAAGSALGGAVLAAAGHRALPVLATALIVVVAVLVRASEPAAPRG
jgi:DHA1 family inner membrane transport protein